MLKKVIISFGLLLCFNSANADGWSGGSIIVEIYPSPGSNGVYIKHSSMPNPDTCSSPSYYFLDKNNIFFDEIFSLLMSAQARKSIINLHLSGCGGPNNIHPKIQQVIAK